MTLYRRQTLISAPKSTIFGQCRTLAGQAAKVFPDAFAVAAGCAILVLVYCVRVAFARF